ncbi:metallophosphoesterase family protein [Nocardioides sp. J2M5]|uniref:metallophosphoesterase n=1 Tax=Nocardioides palaemonis TaxID=2829810 RepID=UPI001BA87A75|nr:metallophosphoesterase [Nocardioides palaemonis]MBS2939467.1 metallophosphoesterase family protein [Nocardioides palaemonis]
MTPAPGRARTLPRRLAVGAVLLAVGVLLGGSVAVSLFLTSSRTVVLVGHDTVVRPTLTGDAVVETGPLLPDFRFRDVGPVGVDLALGKTEVGSIEELVDRYGFIATDPTAQVGKVRDVVVDMAVTAALRGLAVGLVPVAVYLLLGRHRRGELFRGVRSRQGVVALALLLTLPVLVWQPWESDEETQEEQGTWQTLADLVGPDVTLPAEARDIEVRVGPVTTETKKLVLSAIDTYDRSKAFYSTAAEQAADLDVREPQEGETVALLVSDRHDNIGMDRVARAIGEAAGATVVLDAGDDTSTGQPWEAFSLDSLAGTFEDWDRFGVAGNHDHGTFVSTYLADAGWTMLDGDVVDAPWGGTLMGVDDPRSSGLGNWRDESGLSFAEVGTRLADAACAEAEDGERVSTLLVHDANLGREALERGCADLVVGGHTHVHSGPDPVEAEDGTVGWTWTNGTTGGAAYAIAVGSKPRRDAEVSLITYADGRPIGLQLVRLRTDGSWVVGDWSPLEPG